MATRSSVLAWRIPGTGEPGGLLSMGSHRVGHDWSDLAAAAAVSLNPATTVTLLTWGFKWWTSLLRTRPLSTSKSWQWPSRDPRACGRLPSQLSSHGPPSHFLTHTAYPPLNSLLLLFTRSSLRHHTVPEAVLSPSLKPCPSTSAPSFTIRHHSAHLTSGSFCCAVQSGSPNGAAGIEEPVLVHACELCHTAWQTAGFQ